MRIFAFMAICLFSLSLNAQNCKKLILKHSTSYHDFSYDDLSSSMVSSTLNRTKREYIQKLIRPIYELETFPQIVIYFKENKGSYTAKFKVGDDENVMKITKIEKLKENFFYIYVENDSPIILDLKENYALILSKKEVIKLEVNQSLCEF